ncbi:hypothetical protein SUGI_0129400 [Cryptomeria japonica]|nr:hypothetical protein SUGI_0129400 [Cryptomeria japonica]
MSLSCDVATRVVEEIDESERIAEAGDDGGRRSLHGSERHEINGNMIEMGFKAMEVIPNDALIYSYQRGDSTWATTSPVSPLTSDIIVLPLSDNPLLVSKGDVNKNQQHQHPQKQVNRKKCSHVMEYIMILSYLGVFGIIGVLIRYGLQILFGPNVANVTNKNTALYIDLPSNMVGSFFMGWVGVAFKRNISIFSEALAIGLSSGLMGSITTFTSWIQAMVNLATKGHWITGIFGLLLGMELAQMSLELGIESTKLITYAHIQIKKKQLALTWMPSSEHYQCGKIVDGLYGWTIWSMGKMVYGTPQWTRNWSKKTLKMAANRNIAYESHDKHCYGCIINNSPSG